MMLFLIASPISPPGSESCSSVGSSSSSLSRLQLPLPASAPPRSKVPSAPTVHPGDTRGSGHPDSVKSVPPQLPPATTTANYYMLPLEASGIPPGSVLVNPHTGDCNYNLQLKRPLSAGFSQALTRATSAGPAFLLGSFNFPAWLIFMAWGRTASLA